MQDSVTWRELLGRIIQDPQGKQDIANESGVSPLTLTRWVNGESTPRSQNIRHLLLALPNYRKRFLELMSDEFGPSLTDSLAPEEPQEILAHFYAQVLETYARVSPVLRFNVICDLILQEALVQLDPNFVGMEITIAQCMPPSKDGKVRSLRESIGRGTPPWNRELEQHTYFLGSETLAGYVVATGRPMAIPSRQSSGNLFPVSWVNDEQSVLAHPIMRADRVAGCLLISCAQANYFHSSARQVLVQNYAELLSIAFDPDSFYALHAIKLGRMPPFEQQSSYVATFLQRLDAMTDEMHMSMPEARARAWQQIEEELLGMLAHCGTPEQRLKVGQK